MTNKQASEQGTREAQREQAAATKLDAKVRATARAAEDKVAELNNLIGQAIESKAFLLLGFASWQSYVADIASKDMPQLSGIARNSLIKFLTAKGMSRRAVAQATNTSVGTVSNVANGSTQGEPQNQTGKGGARKGVAQTRRTPATIAVDAIATAISKLDNTSLEDLKALHAKLTSSAVVVGAAIDNYTKRQRQLVAEEAAKDARKTANEQGSNGRTGQVKPSDLAAQVKVDAAA